MSTHGIIVAGLSDGRLVRIDISSQNVSPFSGRTRCDRDVLCASHPSDKRVFSTAAPDEIGIWDADTLLPVGRLGRHPKPIDHLAVLDDGHLVALSHGRRHAIRLSRWDIQSLQQTFTIMLPAAGDSHVSFKPFQPFCLARRAGFPVIAVLHADAVTCVRCDDGSVIDRIDIPFDDEYAPPTGLITIGGSRLLCVFRCGTFGVLDMDSGMFHLISTEPTMNEWDWVAGVAAAHNHFLVATNGGHLTCLDGEGEIDAEMHLCTNIACMCNTTDAVVVGALGEIVVATPNALLNGLQPVTPHASDRQAWSQSVDHAYAGAAGRLITIGPQDMIVWHHRRVVARCALSPAGSEQPSTFEGAPMIAHAISQSARRLVTICNWSSMRGGVELRVWDVETGELLHAAQPFGDVAERSHGDWVMSTCFFGDGEDRIVCGHVGGAVTVVAVDESPRVLQMFRVGGTKVHDVTTIDTTSVLALHGRTWQLWILEPQPQLIADKAASGVRVRVVEGSRSWTRMVREDILALFGQRARPKPEQEMATRAAIEWFKVKLEGPFGCSWWIGDNTLDCVAINHDGELVVGDSAGHVWHLICGVTKTGLEPDLPESALPGTVTNSIGMKLVPIPAGEFLMGSPEDCRFGDPVEEFQHLVRITRPFLLGMHQVTQAQYERVTGGNPSFFKGPDLPVEHLTWSQATRFCELLSDLPEERAAGRRYLLPTEAEWEYACRAGTTTTFNTGDSLELHQARFATKSRSSPKQTAPVGSYPPNAWGLYDMHGNVWEWTSDWFSADYFHESPVDDPQGPPTGTHHTLRGGSASVEAHECRCAIRGEAGAVDGPETDTGNRYPLYGDFGIRVVCQQGS
jgi:formylglycine-generating enzyme required for sulfatase activity